jgi:Holliday junction resolvasome RuvABC endonuclease subunit
MVEMTNELAFEKLDALTFRGIKLRRLGTYLHAQPGFDVMGIDPGYKFGITRISSNGYAYLYYGELSDKETHPAIAMYEFMSEYLMVLAGPLEIVFVEGASYNARYGQVKLESIRSGIVMALHLADIPIKVVPPATWRKAVFGSSQIKAEEVWKIRDHAADSLAIAMYAANLTYNQRDQSVSLSLPNK